MKDSKRIDNKAKSRRIAAYALAGCMAVTAAPMTMPGMGAEVVKAAELTELASAEYGLSVVNNIKNTTTFAEVASKLSIKATDTSDSDKYLTWAKTATNVEIKDATSGNLVWNTGGDTSVSGKTKFEYGKSYTVTATFKKTAKTGNSASPTYTGLTVTNDTVTTDVAVCIWPTEGMLSSTLDSNQYIYKDKNGTRDNDKTGVFKNDKGWFLVKNGTTLATPESTPLTKETLAKNSNGTWFIGTNGMVDFTKTGIVTITGLEAHADVSDGDYYVENGKVNYNKTGLVQQNGVWYNVVKGKVAGPNKNAAVIKAPDGRWYYIDPDTGASDTSASGFTGVATNSNGTWYIEDGVVDFTKEGPVYVDSDGADVGLGAEDVAYFLLGGKVQSDTTGVVFYDDDAYYLKKGVIGEADFDGKTLAKDVKTGKWYVLDETGKRISFTGLVTNSNGTWYTDNGIVEFDKTDIIGVNDDNEVPMDSSDVTAEYYVENGKVQSGKNGIQVTKIFGGWELVINLKNGKISGLDIDKSVVKASNGKWYSIGSDGYSARGSLGGNSNGIWLSNNDGVIDFKQTGFHKVTEEEGKLSGIEEDDIVYIKDGKLQSDVSGVVLVKRANIPYPTEITPGEAVMLKNGVVVDEMNVKGPTVVKGIDGIWYYVDEDGKYDKDFNGIASNSNGTWYVSNGKVDFKKTGFVENTGNPDDDKIYYVVNSKVVKDKTGLVKTFSHVVGDSTDKLYYVEKGIVTGKKTNDNVVKSSDGVWYYVDEDGKTNSSFTGLAENKNGVWYIKDGRVDFTKKGIVAVNASDQSDKIEEFGGANVYVVGGKVQFDFTGLVVENGDKVYFEKGQEAQNDDPVLIKATDGNWYYVVAGEVKADYTGLAKNSNGIWYVYNGKVSFSKTGIINQPTDLDDAKLDAGKYYVANGKMSSDKNGIVKSGNTEYYVKKSAVVKDTPADESVIKVDGTWYYINPQGEVDVPTDHIAENKNGVWYIDDKGRVDFKKAGLVHISGTNAVLTAAQNQDIYISGGKFQEDAECVVVIPGSPTNTYVNKGMTHATSPITNNKAVKGTDGKLYGVSKDNGNAMLPQNHLAKGEDGIYCVTGANGLIDIKKTAKVTVPDDAASLGLIVQPTGSTKDVVIINGKVATDITKGFVKVGTARYYVEKGVCTPTTGTTTIIKDTDDAQTRYYVGTAKFTVDTSYTDKLGYDGTYYWYVSSGKVKYVTKNNFKSNVDGTDKVYNIKEGKAEVSTGADKRLVTGSDTMQYLLKATGEVYKDATVTDGSTTYTIDPTTGEVTNIAVSGS